MIMSLSVIICHISIYHHCIIISFINAEYIGSPPLLGTGEYSAGPVVHAMAGAGKNT